KRLGQSFLAPFHDLLNRELLVLEIEARYDPEKLPLPISDFRPPTGEEVSVQLHLDRVERDNRGFGAVQLLDEDIEDFPANELDEVGVTARLARDDLDRIVTEAEWALGDSDRLQDRLSAVLIVQPAKHDDVEHTLGERARLHELREESGETSQNKKKRDSLLLDR